MAPMAVGAESVPQSQDRVESLISWIQKNRVLLLQTNQLKLQLDVKGSSVIGNVTLYPEA